MPPKPAVIDFNAYARQDQFVIDRHLATKSRTRDIDFDRIKNAALQDASRLLQHWLPGGRTVGPEYICGDLDGGPGHSLSINIHTGVWKEFGTGEGGADLISLYAAIHRVKNGAAARAIAKELGLEVMSQSTSQRASQRLNKKRSPTSVEPYEMHPASTGNECRQAGPLGSCRVIVPIPETAPPPPDSHPRHGHYSMAWEYRDQKGRLLGRVCRFEKAEGGKHICPQVYVEENGRSFWKWKHWDAPRPLYRLESLTDQDTVLLVEGEKAADAAARLVPSHTAVLTWSGGVNSVAKADLSPLQGKHIILWPDNDQPGIDCMHRLADMLHRIGAASTRIVTLPEGLPEKWDLANAEEDGWATEHVMPYLEDAESTQADEEQSASFDLSLWETTSVFCGEPPPREWLVRGVFPRGQVSLVAAAGGVGKSYMLLAMGREIPLHGLSQRSHFGGQLEQTGCVVYISAEDDTIEIHNRLHRLGGPSPGLFAVPLPNAGGARPYFQEIERQFLATDRWYTLIEQLKRIENLTTLIVDPIQPLCAMDMNKPEAAQAVCSYLADLAAQLGIAVIVSHHFRKAAVANPEDARNAIRGTAGLVDGVRSVFALWQAPESEAQKVMQELRLPSRQDSLVYGCVVKGNSEKLCGVRSFIRSASGVLVDRTSDLQTLTNGEQLQLLLMHTIALAAADGKPYTRTGKNGVYERRAELPDPLHIMPRNTLWALTEALIDQRKICVCSAKGQKLMQWLDVLSGPFASGEGQFEPGFFSGK